jgi:hypothetical protein
MSSLAWLVVYFFIFVFICLAVYVAVVRAFYWGDRKEPPSKKR